MRRKNVALARGLRHRMTEAERVVWRHLRGRRFEDWKFRRQHAIGAYIVDFVCLEARLVVELDGGHHLDQTATDRERTRVLERENLRVIRFWNDEVLLHCDAVLEAIHGALTNNPPHPDPLPFGEREKNATLAGGLV